MNIDEMQKNMIALWCRVYVDANNDEFKYFRLLETKEALAYQEKYISKAINAVDGAIARANIKEAKA